MVWEAAERCSSNIGGHVTLTRDKNSDKTVTREEDERRNDSKGVVTYL